MTTSSIITLVPKRDLAEHPRLTGFPMLSPDAFNALVDSVVDHGIQQALVVTPTGIKPEFPTQQITRFHVYDGRNRLKVANRLDGLDEVPIIIRPIEETQVLSYALESAVVGRQLTKSAIAFLLFEQHPELASHRNKGGRPKKPVQNAPVSEVDSFTKLAARYQIDRRQFIYLAEIRASATEEEWDLLRERVFVEEAPISRLFAGWSSPQKPGSKRAAINWLTYSEELGRFDGVMVRPLKSLANAFMGDGRKAYDALPMALKSAYAKTITDTLVELPEDLQKEIRRLL